MSSATVSYAAAAAAAAQSPAKYVPVHRRAPGSSGNAAPHRSPSPTPSDASTSTLVGPETSSTSGYQLSCAAINHLLNYLFVVEPLVYSIDDLLHLAHNPEIKLISLAQKDKLRETMPEIVMNRKMRKASEYHAIQERVRAKAQDHTQSQNKNDHHATETPVKNPHPHPVSGAPVKLSQQRQRPGMRKPGVERRRNANKVMDGASWRVFRLPSVAV
ncbi:hypothetical protein AN958_00506 [Leucoagaricus sp. SymC.cos]|nr:hypothetical protein AN958_00506 [Leucoagaricus sp. SymC.cos]